MILYKNNNTSIVQKPVYILVINPLVLDTPAKPVHNRLFFNNRRAGYEHMKC